MSCRSACRTSETWSLAQRMAAEKESFGFYFSAHPVDNYRHLALAHGARRFAELAALPAPADGGRTGAVMAGLVEDTRWRTSARGRRYMMATLSDASGQFEATIFDDVVAEQVAGCGQGGRLRPANGRARPPPGRGDAARHHPLAAGLRGAGQAQPPPARGRGRRTRQRCAMLAAIVAGERGGNGVLRLKARFDGGEAELVLGRDFNVDAELAARLERIEGDRLGRACGRRSAPACAGRLSA